MQKSLRIAIIGGSEFAREGLRRILTARGFAVRGVSSDHLDLDTDFTDSNFTHLILINSATQRESIEICRLARDRWPSCRLVIFAGGFHFQEVYEAFRAGIDGYIGRHVSIDVLEQMLKLVASGEQLVPSELLLEHPGAQHDMESEELHISLGDAKLSEREMEILRSLIRGDANKVIARRMAIAEATVKIHVKSILRKVSVTNRTQAAIWGLSRGIDPAARQL